MLWGDRRKPKWTWQVLGWDVLTQNREGCDVTAPVGAGNPPLRQGSINRRGDLRLFIHISPSKHGRTSPHKQCVPLKTFSAPFYFPGPLENIKRLSWDTSEDRGQLPYVLVQRELNTNTSGSNLVLRL